MRRRGIGRPSVVGTVARTAVIAGTASAVVGHSAQKQQAASVQAAQAQAQQQAQMEASMQAAAEKAVAQAQPAPAPAPAPAVAPAAGEPSVVDQLKELASLKQAGVLSDTEFEAAKAKVLAG